MNKVLVIMKFIYATILRELVFNAIDNPDSEVDEFVLKLLDRLFDYDG
ncbi:hypothetical protein LCGC14_1304480 [marine sediment metagenome]|uniref:Uncharacterized protein n=1 Tax=marine sediment metagenome TaxID=412755 RepID=A0A0F9N5D3_9ZZZZ